MIALLKALPAVLVLLVGLAGGSAVTGALSWAWLAAVHDPAIRREATVTLTAAVQRATDAAIAAEQARQFRANEAATQQYLKQKALDDAAQQAKDDTLEKEIADYEREKSAAAAAAPANATAGGDCHLTQRDLDFLGGVQHH